MPEIERKPRWNCKLCNKRMSIEHGQIHLSGSLHKKNLDAFNAKQPLDTEKVPAWNCTICNLTATIGSLESHLVGKRHRATLEAKKDGKTPDLLAPSALLYKSQPPSMSTRSADNTGKITEDPAQVPNLTPVDNDVVIACLESEPKWRTCPVCSITMYVEAYGRHKAGKCAGKKVVIEFKPSTDEDSVTQQELDRSGIDRQKGLDTKKVKSRLGFERIKRVRR